jgi:hypothetical protein
LNKYETSSRGNLMNGMRREELLDVGVAALLEDEVDRDFEDGVVREVHGVEGVDGVERGAHGAKVEVEVEVDYRGLHSNAPYHFRILWGDLFVEGSVVTS